MTEKESIYLNIADFNIEINFYPTELEFAKNLKKEEITKYWSGFIVKKPKKIDFRINFINKNPELFELKKTNKTFFLFYKSLKRSIFTYYFISFIQLQFLFRQILFLLLKNKGFIIHCSAVADKNNNAYLFLGKPGSGKSTIASLIKGDFKQLADDTGIIKKEGKNYFFYQTPFIEKKELIKNNFKYQVKKIFFLKKDQFFKIEKIEDKKYILNRIIKQIFLLENNFKKNEMKILFHLINKIDFYFIFFDKDKKIDF
ncbi:MAG: hypothetical protein ACPLRN_03465 [Microgenomates group bacterium]